MREKANTHSRIVGLSFLQQAKPPSTLANSSLLYDDILVSWLRYPLRFHLSDNLKPYFHHSSRCQERENEANLAGPSFTHSVGFRKGLVINLSPCTRKRARIPESLPTRGNLQETGMASCSLPFHTNHFCRQRRSRPRSEISSMRSLISSYKQVLSSAKPGGRIREPGLHD